MTHTDGPDLGDLSIDDYVDSDEIISALRACQSVGATSAAAEIIADIDWASESELDADELNGVIATLGAALQESPRALVVQGRVNIKHGYSDRGYQCIRQAAEMALLH